MVEVVNATSIFNNDSDDEENGYGNIVSAKILKISDKDREELYMSQRIHL